MSQANVLKGKLIYVNIVISFMLNLISGEDRLEDDAWVTTPIHIYVIYMCE